MFACVYVAQVCQPNSVHTTTLMTLETHCTPYALRQLGRYRDSLQARRPRNRIPVGGKDSPHTRPGRPWGSHSLLYNGHRVSLPAIERTGRGVDHHPHPAPRSGKSTAIPLFPLGGHHGVLPYLSFTALSAVNKSYEIYNYMTFPYSKEE